MSIRLLSAALAGLATFALSSVAPAAMADRPSPVTTYEIPTGTEDPFGISAGPGGTWLTHGGTIDRIRPGGQIDQFAVPDPSISDPDYLYWRPGWPALWFGDQGVGRLGQIYASGRVQEYQIPDGPNGTASPKTLVFMGRTGLWFTDQVNDRIGRFDLRTRHFTFWTVPTPDGNPLGLARGADGALYFVERSATKVGRLDPHTGRFTEWALPPESFPNRITLGGDGAVWFTELGTSQIGRLTTSGRLTQFSVPGGPVGIIAVGARLYTALATDGALGEVDLHGRLLRTWSLPAADTVLLLARVHRAIWVADGFGDHVYRVAVRTGGC